MRNIPDKIDVTTNLDASEFNSNQSELENIVTSADSTLDPPFGPDTDLNMLAKTLSAYVNAGIIYQDSGTANTKILAIASNLKSVIKYYDNMLVTFKNSLSNTGATTIKIGSLSSKALTRENGDALIAGDLTANKIETAIYNLTSDRFELLLKTYPKKTYSQANGDFTITSSLSGWIINSSAAIPYRTINGAWKVRLNFDGVFSPPRTGLIQFDISGLTFASHRQSLAASLYESGTTGTAGLFAETTDPAYPAKISILANGNFTEASISGEFELSAKPTWAD